MRASGNMFRPDLPISSSKEDLLARTPFARSLAEALIAYEHKESLVTALYGPWGSGKSSVINVILERVSELSKDRAKEDRPLVVRFNPWNYSDQNQLIGQFFRSLSVALRRHDAGDTAKKAGEQLDAYAEFFAPLTLIPDPTGLGNILSVAANAVLKKAGVALVAWGKLKEKDLDKVRKELDTLLEKQSRKILIVIDDIDRLNTTEIRQIFQLVKSLGDFPNTIYLLAFDDAIVSSALAQEQSGSGREYLEKIVQVPFELPVASIEEVHKVLFSRLDELIGSNPSERWDGTYWGNVFHGGLKHFFGSLRDVNRYVNALRLAYPMVAQEVNPVDFLAITALQVFEPALYQGIRDNEDLFAGCLDEGYGSRDKERAQAQSRCDEILARRLVIGGDQLKELLQRLFPKVESIYERMGYGSDFLASWRAEGRICSPEKFPVFFRLSLPPGEIPESEMVVAIASASSEAGFAETLLQEVKAGRVVRFIERLMDYTKERVPLDHVPNVVAALMDVGDSFPEGSEGGLFERDTSMQIMRVFYQLLKRYDSQEARFTVLRDAIDGATGSIYTLVREVGLQAQEHGERTLKGEQPEPMAKRAVSPEHLAALKTMAATKIEEWANEGRLLTHPELASILYSWREFGEEGEVKAQAFVRRAIDTDAGVLSVVCAFESRSLVHGMSDRVGKFRYKVNLKSIADFVDVEALGTGVRKIAEAQSFSAVLPEQQRAVRGFIDALEGKKSDAWD
jgi:predicted KAP-like P-loop ATPase